MDPLNVSWMPGTMLASLLARFGGGGREEKSGFLYQLTAKQALKEMVQLDTHNLSNTGKAWLGIYMEYLSIPYWYFIEIS